MNEKLKIAIKTLQTIEKNFETAIELSSNKTFLRIIKNQLEDALQILESIHIVDSLPHICTEHPNAQMSLNWDKTTYFWNVGGLTMSYPVTVHCALCGKKLDPE